MIEESANDIEDADKILESNSSCLVETHFSGKAISFIGQDVQMNDTISINFDGFPVDFEVKGIAQDTDFLYVVDENSLMPLMGELAVIWINLETIQKYLFSSSPLINQILYTVEDRFNIEMTLTAADKLSYLFTNNNIDANISGRSHGFLYSLCSRPCT